MVAKEAAILLDSSARCSRIPEEVNYVLNRRGADNVSQYRVKWRGFPEDQATRNLGEYLTSPPYSTATPDASAQQSTATGKPCLLTRSKTLFLCT